MIGAALFDMDGLLIDSERIYSQGFKAVMGGLGIYLSDDALHRAMGTPRRVTDQIFAEGNPNYDSEKLHIALEGYLRDHGYDTAMPLKPYAGELLRHLNGWGVPCVLVTSTGRARAEAYMKNAGLLPLFRAVVTGDMGLTGKPAPDVYLKAADLLHVEISRCAVLEDSYNGLRAGRAAGAVTIMVPDLIPYGPEIAPCCDHVVRDLREAEVILCR